MQLGFAFGFPRLDKRLYDFGGWERHKANLFKMLPDLYIFDLIPGFARFRVNIKWQ